MGMLKPLDFTAYQHYKGKPNRVREREREREGGREGGRKVHFVSCPGLNTCSCTHTRTSSFI